MGSGALVRALSTSRCAFVPFRLRPAAESTLNPLSSLVPRRGLGLNLFRVGLNSFPCIFCAVFAHILMKVPFFFRSVRCDSGVVATYQRILHFHCKFVVPHACVPLCSIRRILVIKVIESMDLVSKYPFYLSLLSNLPSYRSCCSFFPFMHK